MATDLEQLTVEFSVETAKEACSKISAALNVAFLVC